MPSAHPAIGFQAVILCGPGTSLYPFTGAEDLPKALLPIANKPMLHYPLEWCEKAGFDSILILTLAEHHPAIQSYLRSHRLQKSNTDIQVEPASGLNDNAGTADVLRTAFRRGWLKTDFCVLPCDLVTNLPALEVAQLWMVEQAGFDSDMGLRSRRSRRSGDADEGRRGALGVWYETRGEGAVKGQETDFVAVAPLGNGARAGKVGEGGGALSQLLYTVPGEQLKSDGGEVPIRGSLARRHPNVQLLATKRDSGIYFFPHWVLRLIDKNPGLNSLREDVLPWWAKACWQSQRLAARLGLMEILAGRAEDADGESEDGDAERYEVGGMSSTRRRNTHAYTAAAAASSAAAAAASRVPGTAREAIELAKTTPRAAPEHIRVPSITAFIPAAPTAFVRRVDTVHLYLFTSLHLAKTDPTANPAPQKVDPSASISPSAKITHADCLIADKVSIGEKAQIKRCVLGSGVSIGKGVRLTGCVLMDGAAVAEGAKLEGCTIGRRAIVGVKANLKDCEVAEGYVVEEGAEAKNERFVAFTGLDAAYVSDGSGLDSQDASDGADGEDDYDDDDVEEDDAEVDASPPPKPQEKTIDPTPTSTAKTPAPPPPTATPTPPPEAIKSVDLTRAAEIVKAGEERVDKAEKVADDVAA